MQEAWETIALRASHCSREVVVNAMVNSERQTLDWKSVYVSCEDVWSFHRSQAKKITTGLLFSID